MTTLDRSRCVRALGVLPLFLAGVVGCSTEQQGSAAGDDATAVGQAYDALAGKLAECEVAKRSCRDATSCVAAELAACDADFDTCRDAAEVDKKALKDAAHACKEAKDACEADAADEAARASCRDAQKACMKPTQPSEPPCHAELRTCLDEARDDVVAERPKIEAPAGDAPAPVGEIDAGTLPVEGEPELDCVPDDEPMKPKANGPAESACHEQAEACMLAELAANPPPEPPKCAPTPPAAMSSDRSDAGAPPPSRDSDAARPPPPARDGDAAILLPPARDDAAMPKPPMEGSEAPPANDDAGVRPPPRRMCPPGMKPAKPSPRADAGR